MNTIRAVKISLAWISIAWTGCSIAFGLIGGLGPAAMPYHFHGSIPMENIFTIGDFITGLIAWNVIVAAGVLLAGRLGHLIED